MSRDDHKFVFFDFDGVIADTWHVAFETGKAICPDMTEEDNRRKFEGNVNDWFQSRFGHSDKCRHDLDWWEIYLPLFEKAHPFPGSIRAVQDIGEKYRMAVISSTISSPIMEFLQKYDAAQYFDDILGNDIHASKVEKMNMLFERYSLTKDHCVFVTDTLGDMREAEKVGVGTIGVSWGFHEHERLQKGNPFKIVDHPHELSVAVEGYFSSVSSVEKTWDNRIRD